MNPLLELRDIQLKTGGKIRLQDIHLEINEGEKIALLGKSGSGKTTLLKIFNGTLSPTSGNVIFNGSLYKLLLFFRFFNETIISSHLDFLKMYCSIGKASKNSLAINMLLPFLIFCKLFIHFTLNFFNFFF